jgi:MOSC domain-containing protein YiiM
MPELVAVNVVYAIRPGAGRETAIDKRPVTGPVELAELGLAGDTQCDRRSHGGPDKAVYTYSVEDSAWWAAELGRAIPPGTFGENLSIAGLDHRRALIGERWRIGGEVVVEVRMPRTPCDNLSLRMGMRDFHRRFSASRRVGAYLRVVQPGTIAAGDVVTVVRRPRHGVAIADWIGRRDPEHARRLLASGIDLADVVRRTAVRASQKA